jgi:hypothetical protein
LKLGRGRFNVARIWAGGGVCGISADHSFALAAMLVGLRRHNPGLACDLVVFHDGVLPDQQAHLRRLWPRVIFQPFNATSLAARFGAGVDLAALLAAYSPLILAKFEALDLLSAYHQCLWLDVDILVQADISAVWQFDTLAWRPLPDGAFARRAKPMAAFATLQRAGYPLLNGGVIGMGQGLRGRLSAPDLYAMAARIIAQVGPHSVDELAFYFTAAGQDLPLHRLALGLNHPVTAPGGRDATILHAIGPDKFWNAAPLQLAYPEWAQNAVLSGMAYSGPQRLGGDATPDAALKSARNRCFWAETLDDLRGGLPAGLTPDLRGDGPTLRLHIKARPDTVLCLTRLASPRKLGVDLTLPQGHTSQPEGLMTANADGYRATAPLAKINALLRRIMAVL